MNASGKFLNEKEKPMHFIDSSLDNIDILIKVIFNYISNVFHNNNEVLKKQY